MEFKNRSLSAQESRGVLSLRERGRREVTRADIVKLLGSSLKAVDRVIGSLRRKGWLERAAWGEYLLIPPEQGPDALGESNLLALASRIANPYYIGFSTAAAHYGLTTQHRNIIFLVTPEHLRARRVGEAQVRIVNPKPDKFFGFDAVDVLGYKVMISDREKTAIDCIDRPALAGGAGEAATILAAATRRFDWTKAASYLERIGSGALVRRFGWLADHVQADMPPDIRQQLMHLIGRSTRARLGRAHFKIAHKTIGYDKTLRIFAKETREERHDSAGVGRSKSVRKAS